MARTIQVRIENDPHAAMGEDDMLAKLKRSREHCREGRYREADKVISDLRRKYGFEGIVTEEVSGLKFH